MVKPKLRKLIYTARNALKTKTFTDDYINWLCFANAGMLNKGNIYSMNLAIKNLPSNNPILEIGSFCGLSANIISYLLYTGGRTNKLLTCDKWVFEGSQHGGNLGKSNISHQQYREHVKSTFMRNVGFFSPQNKPHTIEVFSDEFFVLWEKNEPVKDVFNRDVQLGGGFSFCYIDGNHTYDFAKRDFENVDRYLDVGGYILFDDSSDDDPFGLTKLMREIKRNKKYDLVIKNPNYLFRKRRIS
ncbi:MAG: class I SAM-dependent methyltransferase [bacterium]|nr:class I SAM-dependent methyltransferase [bacterium]